MIMGHNNYHEKVTNSYTAKLNSFGDSGGGEELTQHLH